MFLLNCPGFGKFCPFESIFKLCVRRPNILDSLTRIARKKMMSERHRSRSPSIFRAVLVGILFLVATSVFYFAASSKEHTTSALRGYDSFVPNANGTNLCVIARTYDSQYRQLPAFLFSLATNYIAR